MKNVRLTMPGSWHDKVGWKAEQFFDDPQVQSLCQAIEEDDLPKIRLLVTQGADVNARGKDDITPLFWAFPDNKIERFRLLLELGANPNVKIKSDLGVPQAFRKGNSVLDMAAVSQFPDHFLAAMEHGGDPNSVNGRGDPIIHQIVKGAAINAQERIAVALKAGADINGLSLSHNITAFDQSLTWLGQFELAYWLLEQGADPTVYGKEQLTNGLHSALMLKRDTSGNLQADRRIALQRVIDLLEQKGYDLKTAQEDIDRWAQLADKRPASPGWWRKGEIAKRLEREAKQKDAIAHGIDNNQ